MKCREWLARTHENIASTAILDLDFVAAEKVSAADCLSREGWEDTHITRMLQCRE